MTDKSTPAYQIDGRWKIVRANEGFCRTLQCTESSLIGRDIRDLLRADWRLDFRTYIARALVGVGDCQISLPLVAPCGKESWYRHQVEPIMDDGSLAGYRATVEPQFATAAATDTPRRWWEWRPVAFRQVWNTETEPLARAS